MKKIKLLTIIFAISCMGCSNFLESFSNKNSDNSLYEAGVLAMNESNWDLALAKFEALSPTYFASEEKKLMFASAYAGKCGLNFISYAANLGSVSLGGSTLFSYFMNQWTGIAIYPSSCASAEQWINAISTDPNARSGTANFNMMILAMVKVGVYLRNNADIDGVGNLGDGTTDPTFDSCAATPVGSGVLDDNQAKEVVSGFANFLVNATSNLSSLSSDLQTAITALTAVCSTLAVNPCAMTESSGVSVGAVAAIRDLLKSGTTGIEACMAGDPNTCCP